MERKLGFLVLTDHSEHKPGNPIYTLLPELLTHPNCKSVHVASRGNPANDDFFIHHRNTQLEVLEIQEEFGYEESGNQFFQTKSIRDLSSYDCILMRVPHPVTTAFLDFLAEKGKELLIINDPQGIDKTSDKAYLLNFPELCPPMKLCYSIKEILDFGANFPIVLKPLKAYGGKGILKIERDTLYESKRQHKKLEFLSKQESYIQKEGYLVMKFLEQVSQGDKRILIVEGEIMGASLRMPAEGSWLCNVAQGGNSVSAEVEPEERQIIEHINPFLENEGILIAGIDTLVGDDGKRVLSEINTLSVGGFQNIQELSGRPIINQTIQTVIDYVYKKNGY